MKTGNVTHQIVETVSCYFSGAVQIDTVEFLHDLGMIGNLEIRNNGLAVFLDLHVLTVIFTDRYGRIDDVRNDHHSGADLFLHLLLLLGELVHAVSLAGNLLFDLFCLFFFLLSHQSANLFGKFVSGSTKSLYFLFDLTVLFIQLDHFIYEMELFILKFITNILFYDFRIFPDKFNIQHFFYSFLRSSQRKNLRCK